MEAKKVKCNVVLMGKSGAGKSSFDIVRARLNA